MDICICDDNPVCLEEMRRQTARLTDPRTDRIHTTLDGGQLLALLEDRDPWDTAVILDIQLEREGEGIRLAREINRSYPGIPVIFVTAYLHYASDTGEAEAIYFLAKPIDDGRLQKALRKARRALEQRFLTVHTQGRTDIVRLSEILYLERVKRTTCLHAASGTLETAESLDDLLLRLRSPRFTRTHKSFVVNLEHVREVRPGDFLLTDGVVVPVSRTYRRLARESLFDYLGGGPE